MHLSARKHNSLQLSDSSNGNARLCKSSSHSIPPLIAKQNILSGQRVFPKPIALLATENTPNNIPNLLPLGSSASNIYRNQINQMQPCRVWNEDHDQVIICHVQINGERSWAKVSRTLKRSASECRDRWNLVLRPNLVWHQRQVDAEVSKRGRVSLNRTSILQKNHRGKVVLTPSGLVSTSPGRIIANAAAATVMASSSGRYSQSKSNSSQRVPLGKINENWTESKVMSSEWNDGIQRSWLEDNFYPIDRENVENIPTENFLSIDKNSPLSSLPLIVSNSVNDEMMIDLSDPLLSPLTVKVESKESISNNISENISFWDSILDSDFLQNSQPKNEMANFSISGSQESSRIIEQTNDVLYINVEDSIFSPNASNDFDSTIRIPIFTDNDFISPLPSPPPAPIKNLKIPQSQSNQPVVRLIQPAGQSTGQRTRTRLIVKPLQNSTEPIIK